MPTPPTTTPREAEGRGWDSERRANSRLPLTKPRTQTAAALCQSTWSGPSSVGPDAADISLNNRSFFLSSFLTMEDLAEEFNDAQGCRSGPQSQQAGPSVSLSLRLL